MKRFAILALALAMGLGVPLAPISYAQDAVATAEKAEPQTRGELVQYFKDKFADPRFFNAHWGILIQEQESGDVWYEDNADKLFIPASNEKILTTSSAFQYLGPDFHFETKVCHTGAIEGDTLSGDLVVFGNGDPTIYNRFYKDSRDVFNEWAKNLRGKGITHITGNIIGDDNAWDDERIGSGWPCDELTPWYYAEFSPLSFNENYLDIKFIPPATVDGEVKLEPNVVSTYYTLVNNIKVVAEGNNNVSMYRADKSNTITLSGRVVAGSKPFEETPTITNPTLWYVWAMKESLEQNGITVDGKPMDCDDIEGWDKKADDLDCLITHESPALSDILTMLMKRSQNMFAETMVHAMGWKATGKGTFSAGRKIVQQELEKFGIDPDGYNYADGSGLSRYNYVSPRIIAKIYDGMLKGPNGKHWYDAQAIAGVDGTLRSRMKDTPAQGNVRGKTGLVYAVRSCSGYVTTAGGDKLIFSFLCNGHQQSSSDVDAIYDDVLATIAGYGAKEEK